jgi:amino acid transporter
LLIWVFGGVFTTFGALSYAELGCLIPKTGGEYEYLKTAFSDVFGFIFVWAYTFIYNPAVAAFAALLFSDYALQSFFPNCVSPYYARICLAAAAICKTEFFLKNSNHLNKT